MTCICISKKERTFLCRLRPVRVRLRLHPRCQACIVHHLRQRQHLNQLLRVHLLHPCQGSPAEDLPCKSILVFLAVQVVMAVLSPAFTSINLLLAQLEAVLETSPCTPPAQSPQLKQVTSICRVRFPKPLPPLPTQACLPRGLCPVDSMKRTIRMKCESDCHSHLIRTITYIQSQASEVRSTPALAQS